MGILKCINHVRKLIKRINKLEILYAFMQGNREVKKLT